MLKPMTPEDFCRIWGAKEITTSRHTGRMFLMPDGKTKFGYTARWLVYTKTNSGVFRFRNRDHQQIWDKYHEDYNEQGNLRLWFDGKVIPHFSRNEVEFPYMLASLNEYPREAMMVGAPSDESKYNARAHELIANGKNGDEMVGIIMREFPGADYKEVCVAIWDAQEHFE